MKSNSCKWAWVAVLAAVVGALTAVVVFALRARSKKAACCDCEACFDYDLDDLDDLSALDEAQETDSAEE